MYGMYNIKVVSFKNIYIKICKNIIKSLWDMKSYKSMKVYIKELKNKIKSYRNLKIEEIPRLQNCKN